MFDGVPTAATIIANISLWTTPLFNEFDFIIYIVAGVSLVTGLIVLLSRLFGGIFDR